MGKTYFLVASPDFPPSGPIALGNIITSPSSPEEALNTQAREPIEPVYESYQENWTFDVSRYKQNKLGIWTMFLQMLGAGIDMSSERIMGDNQVYRFDRLETRFFIPSSEYLRASISTPEVQSYIKRKGFRKNLYMITAIKIAVGASTTKEKLRERGVHLQVGVDGTAVGVPLGAGPNIEISKGKDTTISFDNSSDFVFAFRLREIYYSKKSLKHRKYDKGNLFGLDQDGQKQVAGAEEGNANEEAQLEGLAYDDVEAEDFELAGSETKDYDGSACVGVAPDKVGGKRQPFD
ncbi:MAG: hypothetical protein LQ342_006789 [Letrouitia transgressa]|nr:MAG: hypothetical protein LQ342_006789 [Letrouitia transgressa]